MSKIVLISYDLNRPSQNYEELIEAIKKVGGPWWHHLDSCWLVATTKSAKQVRDELRPHIDSNDELLVAKLTGEAAWAGFNDEGSSWLMSNL